MFGLIKHLPSACAVEVCARKQAKMHRLCSQNGRDYLDYSIFYMLRHFEPISFAISKDSDARGEFC